MSQLIDSGQAGVTNPERSERLAEWIVLATDDLFSTLAEARCFADHLLEYLAASEESGH